MAKTKTEVRLLLDTMVVLSAFTDGERKEEALVHLFRKHGAGACAVVSAASLWEIAIKKAQGRLNVSDDLPGLLRQMEDVEILPVTAAHAWRTLTLPRFKDHKDPFDRLIIAQALEENLTVVTSDKAFARYSVKLLTP